MAMPIAVAIIRADTAGSSPGEDRWIEIAGSEIFSAGTAHRQRSPFARCRPGRQQSNLILSASGSG